MAEVKRKFRLGVRQRVVLILLSGLLISLSINSWLSLSEQKRYIDQAIARSGDQLSKIVSRSLTNYVVGYDYHGIQLFIDEIQRDDVAFVKVLSKKGNTMAVAGALQTSNPYLRIFHSDIRLDNEKVGALVIGMNTKAIISQVEMQKASMLQREFLVILFILVLEFFALSFLIVRPLKKISDALAKNVNSKGILPAEIELNSNDELGDIANKFNGMRKQLNDAHHALQGKVDLADKQLRAANEELMEKSRLLEETNLELKNQAITDPLTGLYNRRKFQYVLAHEIEHQLEQNNTLSLLIVDIDHFKKINDNYGHDTGDQVLQQIAKIMSETVRKSDLLCRIGGEEFAVICLESNEDNAINIAEKIRQSIEDNTITTESAIIKVTASVGISTPGVGAHMRCPDCLYRQADIALYQSKTRGRNCVTHFAQVELETIEEMEKEHNHDQHRA